MQDLSAHFNPFIENVSLGQPQTGRIDSATSTIIKFLSEKYGLGAANFFLQGSYANHTAVEPVDDGEYDVDIIAICVEDGVSADDALDTLENVFRQDGNYRDRIKRKKPCVRLEYAKDDVGSFHVDVVPVRSSSSGYAPLDAPRRGDGWHPTAPAEYTQWCYSQGPHFQRLVKIMKRWRDEQQTVRSAIKSIVLQVLISQCMPVGVADDQARLIMTIANMHEKFGSLTSVPDVFNPVLPSENLSQRWDLSSFKSFQRELTGAFDRSTKASTADDKVEAIDAWRELLGEDFPIESPASLGFVLSDFSHADNPQDMGWKVQHDPSFQVNISAVISRGREGRQKHIDEDYLVFAGNWLKFKASIRAPRHVDVWWQVANTGRHARQEDGLRGNIFKARNKSRRSSADQTENWETTAYTGVHLIRALLVRNGVVVAESAWYRVNVWAKRHPFNL